MTIARRGTTRTVFLVGRWAFKVPTGRSWRLFLSGLLANMQEAEFSSTGWPELCPVRFALPGGFLVVMPRAVTLTEPMAEDAYERLTQRPDYVVPAENKPCSWGHLPDGRLVAVDYGS